MGHYYSEMQSDSEYKEQQHRIAEQLRIKKLRILIANLLSEKLSTGSSKHFQETIITAKDIKKEFGW